MQYIQLHSTSTFGAAKKGSSAGYVHEGGSECVSSGPWCSQKQRSGARTTKKNYYKKDLGGYFPP